MGSPSRPGAPPAEPRCGTRPPRNRWPAECRRKLPGTPPSAERIGRGGRSPARDQANVTTSGLSRTSFRSMVLQGRYPPAADSSISRTRMEPSGTEARFVTGAAFFQLSGTGVSRRATMVRPRLPSWRFNSMTAGAWPPSSTSAGPLLRQFLRHRCDLLFRETRQGGDWRDRLPDWPARSRWPVRGLLPSRAGWAATDRRGGGADSSGSAWIRRKFSRAAITLPGVPQPSSSGAPKLRTVFAFEGRSRRAAKRRRRREVQAVLHGSHGAAVGPRSRAAGPQIEHRDLFRGAALGNGSRDRRGRFLRPDPASAAPDGTAGGAPSIRTGTARRGSKDARAHRSGTPVDRRRTARAPRIRRGTARSW